MAVVRSPPHARAARSACALLVALAAHCTCVDGVDDDGGDDGPAPRPRNVDPLTTALDGEVRRLSQAEIDRTLALVIGDDSRPAARLLLGDTFTPYDNNYLEQQSSAALVDALDALATDVAIRAINDDAVYARVVPCVPAAVDDEACFRQVVAGLGRRLLRRPLDDGYRSFNQGFRWRTAPDEQGGPERRDPPHARAITPASADPLIPPITS